MRAALASGCVMLRLSRRPNPSARSMPTTVTTTSSVVAREASASAAFRCSSDRLTMLADRLFSAADNRSRATIVAPPGLRLGRASDVRFADTRRSTSETARWYSFHPSVNAVNCAFCSGVSAAACSFCTSAFTVCVSAAIDSCSRARSSLATMKRYTCPRTLACAVSITPSDCVGFR
jgi:hypothetical protein